MSFVKRGIHLAFAVLLLVGCATGPRYADQKLVYPDAHKVDQIDDYHGVLVADPYRWLEDPDSPETRVWIDAQNELTFGYLGDIPARSEIRERLTELWNYEKYGIPHKKGGRYFFTKNDGLQSQSVLYTMKSLHEKPGLLLDPNKLSEDGTVALTRYSISEDGQYMAYGLSEAGSDWQEWHVRDIKTGTDLPDHLKWLKFAGVSWSHDGSGFYYSRFDEPQEDGEFQDANFFQKIYFHRLGTPQSQDVLVYHCPDHKDWYVGGSVTDDGRYLIISISNGTDRGNRISYKELQTDGSPIIDLIDNFEDEYSFIDNDGPVFWFRTDSGALRSRVIAIDVRRPDRHGWKEIIPESSDTLRSANLVNDTFVVTYLKDAHTQVRMFDMDGRFLRDVELPGQGTAGGFGGRRTDTETFYKYTSFSTPTRIYRYDMRTQIGELYRQPKVAFDPDEYVTRQVFCTSKDGTRVPMFIVHKKGIKLDGANPTYLYGYGGFNVVLAPRFSVSRLVWMEMGGIYVQANLRGGGEYGREWHEAGCKLKRQNVFDDFLAVAQWLIDNDYTRPEKLAIGGASNGGLLVAACMTQRPDLFGAVVADVGVLDMLRFHKFTVGWGWIYDYGSSDDPEEFKALYAYSPLHNLRKGAAYPATLITTADHDDRVVPAHSFKFAAAMQTAQGGDAPVLIRIETKAGHGGGKPTDKRIEEAADTWAFLIRVFKMNM